ESLGAALVVTELDDDPGREDIDHGALGAGVILAAANLELDLVADLRLIVTTTGSCDRLRRHLAAAAGALALGLLLGIALGCSDGLLRHLAAAAGALALGLLFRVASRRRGCRGAGSRTCGTGPRSHFGGGDVRAGWLG